jgi:hypothetical protein
VGRFKTALKYNKAFINKKPDWAVWFIKADT